MTYPDRLHFLDGPAARDGLREEVGPAAIPARGPVGAAPVLLRHRGRRQPRTRATRPRWEAVVGRALDVVLSAAALAVLALPLLVIAAWVRWDSPGPAFYRQPRVGMDGRTFTLWKFRSMRVDSDDQVHRRLIAAELNGQDTLTDGSTKVPRDPRVTRAGHLLRRTSMDELPQLINVLRGEMALVGPRPCLHWEAEMFPAEFADRFTVRPGITGLWQVSGRSRLATPQMLLLDLEYVRSRSLRRDLAILARTVPALLHDWSAR